MRINKQDRHALVSEINGIIVAMMICRDAEAEIAAIEAAGEEVLKGAQYREAKEKLRRWRNADCRHQVNLAEKFGLELPGLEHIRDLLNFDRVREERRSITEGLPL